MAERCDEASFTSLGVKDSFYHKYWAISMNAAKLDRKRQSWREWNDELDKAVGTLASDDFRFRLMMNVIRDNPAARRNGFLAVWLMRIHAQYAHIAIRRLTDWDKRTYSLRRFLIDVRDHCHALTRNSFVAQYPPAMRDIAPEDFDRLVGKHRGHLPRRVVQRDIRKLDRIDSKLGDVTNKIVAHLERNPKITRHPLWRDVHHAIATLEKLCLKYQLLLRTSCPSTLVPVNAEEMLENFQAPLAGRYARRVRVPRRTYR
jgi:hypothetical protein